MWSSARGLPSTTANLASGGNWQTPPVRRYLYMPVPQRDVHRASGASCAATYYALLVTVRQYVRPYLRVAASIFAAERDGLGSGELGVNESDEGSRPAKRDLCGGGLPDAPSLSSSYRVDVPCNICIRDVVYQYATARYRPVPTSRVR